MLHLLLDVQPWTNYLTSLCLTSPLFKTGVITVISLMELLGGLNATTYLECLVVLRVQTSWTTAHALRIAHSLVST